jgi:membrane fusion protein (multidrug efflux system)
MFPGQVVHGHVASIAQASGQESARQPSESAANVAATQRVPVKITFRHDIASLRALRPGMAVIPTINTFSVDRTHRADATLPVATPTSGGSCRVPSRPVSLDRRAAGLWRNI